MKEQILNTVKSVAKSQATEMLKESVVSETKNQINSFTRIAKFYLYGGLIILGLIITVLILGLGKLIS